MKTILFVHGMFMNPKSWQQWVQFFTSKGYACITPPWPYHEGEPKHLRSAIDPGLGSLSLDAVMRHYQNIIGALDEKPIVIGHSMGGLLTQQLVNRGLAHAGVCIDSAAPNGVSSFKFSFLKSNLPVLNPFAGNRPYVMPLSHFHYTFCNTMPMEQAERVYEEYLVPESRNMARSSLGAAGKIDFNRAHVPLLFIAGEKDNIIPASLNEKNFKSYTHATSKRHFKLFPGRTHFICGQPGWEEVAGFVDHWLKDKI